MSNARCFKDSEEEELESSSSSEPEDEKAADTAIQEAILTVFHDEAGPQGAAESVLRVASTGHNKRLFFKVTSIKRGMWDSIYDTIQAIAQHESVDTPPHMHPKYESIDVEPSKKDAPVAAGMLTPSNSYCVL